MRVPSTSYTHTHRALGQIIGPLSTGQRGTLHGGAAIIPASRELTPVYSSEGTSPYWCARRDGYMRMSCRIGGAAHFRARLHAEKTWGRTRLPCFARKSPRLMCLKEGTLVDPIELRARFPRYAPGRLPREGPCFWRKAPFGKFGDVCMRAGEL
jgi:hypothetical protein